jgi:hypothetical protein
MEEPHDDVYRIFKIWLELSSAEEITTLLDLVLAELRTRGYTVTCEVRPPEPQKQ